jgi:hypothetical protein
MAYYSVAELLQSKQLLLELLVKHFYLVVRV